MAWGLDPGSGKEFFSSAMPRRACGPPSLLFGEYQGSLMGVKWPGHDVDHSIPCIAEVKNEWGCTCTPRVPSWCGQGQLYVLAYIKTAFCQSRLPLSSVPNSMYEMGGICSMYGGIEKCIQGLGRKV
jgi:hypothetical protein